MGFAQSKNAEYHLEIAESTPAVLDHYQVRCEVLQEATGFRPGAVTSGYELDERDGVAELRMLFNLIHEGQVVGAVRVAEPSAELARRDGSHTGLHLGQTYDDAALAGRRVAEISRVVVRKEHRGSGAAPVLLDGVLGWCRERGLEMVVGLGNCETDDPRDAALVMRGLEARGLVRRELWLPARPEDDGAVGPGYHPLYTPAERRLAMAGRIAEVPLPRTLRLYASFGAVFTGQPRLNRTFGLMEVPLVAPVPERSLLVDPPWLGSVA